MSKRDEQKVRPENGSKPESLEVGFPGSHWDQTDRESQDSLDTESAQLLAPVLLMSQSAYRQILAELAWPPERGGLLLGPKDHEAVTHFHRDENGDATEVSLTFDHAGLNEVLKFYVKAGLDCKGYVHCHPPGCDRPSYGDLTAVRALFAKERNRKLQRFLIPIVCSGILHPFIVEREDLVEGESAARYATLVLF